MKLDSVKWVFFGEAHPPRLIAVYDGWILEKRFLHFAPVLAKLAAVMDVDGTVQVTRVKS